jgi:tRNA(His) guanylyltransferase
MKKMNKDDFGDRMKAYEEVYTSSHIAPPDFLCVRLDGKGFSKFTKGFAKPFDTYFSDIMIETTRRLMKETHAVAGYTQSDEISLFYAPTTQEYIFGGKVSKINSILASIAAANFNAILSETYSKAVNKLAYFDCRAFAVPSAIEASNALLWRVQDARKNSISALFRWTAGHKAMQGLDQSQMKDYLQKSHNVDWVDLPNRFKYGTYIKPVTVQRYITEEERLQIPEKNRPDALTLVERKEYRELNLGYFGDLPIESREAFVR